MKILVVGASKGLSRAFIEGLGNAGDTLTGVSRTRPNDFPPSHTRRALLTAHT